MSTDPRRASRSASVDEGSNNLPGNSNQIEAGANPTGPNRRLPFSAELNKKLLSPTHEQSQPNAHSPPPVPSRNKPQTQNSPLRKPTNGAPTPVNPKVAEMGPRRQLQSAASQASIPVQPRPLSIAGSTSNLHAVPIRSNSAQPGPSGRASVNSKLSQTLPVIPIQNINANPVTQSNIPPLHTRENIPSTPERRPQHGPPVPPRRRQSQSNMIATNKRTAAALPSIFEAVTNGYATGVEHILNQAPSLADSIDAKGLTPLIYATESCHSKIVELLLQHNASPNQTNNEGKTLLHIACEKGCLEVVKLLEEHGASLSTKHTNEKSALHFAVASNSPKVTEWLLDRSADVNAKAHYGETPLSIAVSLGSESIVRMLLERNADPNSSIDGHSVLHMATLFGYYRVAGVLIRSGANLNGKNKEGKYPLSLINTQNNQKDNQGGMGGKGNNPISEFIHWIFLCACATDEVSYVESILRDASQFFPLFPVGDSFCNISPLSEAIGLDSFKVATLLISSGSPVKLVQENLPLVLFDKGDPALLKALSISLLENQKNSKKKLRLNLANCSLRVLSEAYIQILLSSDELRQIRVINLSHNFLNDLPLNLIDLPALEKVKLEGNPLVAIPDAFKKASHPWSKIREYLKTVRDRSNQWKLLKVLVVGQQGVGKSTLIRSLQSKHHKTPCKQSLSTPTIEIKQFPISSNPPSSSSGSNSSVNSNPSISQTSSNDDDDYILSCWDFGAPEVNKPTHQLFLTGNSTIYMIVFDIGLVGNKESVDPRTFEEIESNLSYWSYQIRDFTNNKNSAVFIVGTHVDQLSPKNKDNISECYEMLQNKFPRQRFGNLCGIHFVSSKTGEGMSELKASIVQTIKQREFFKQIPEKWVKFYDFMTNSPEFHSAQLKEVISKTQLQQLSIKCGIVSTEEQDLLFQFLRDVGLIIIYNQYQSLDSLVILDPKWISNLMNALFTYSYTWVKSGTIPYHELLQLFLNYQNNTLTTNNSSSASTSTTTSYNSSGSLNSPSNSLGSSSTPTSSIVTPSNSLNSPGSSTPTRAESNSNNLLNTTFSLTNSAPIPSNPNHNPSLSPSSQPIITSSGYSISSTPSLDPLATGMNPSGYSHKNIPKTHPHHPLYHQQLQSNQQSSTADTQNRDQMINNLLVSLSNDIQSFILLLEYFSIIYKIYNSSKIEVLVPCLLPDKLKTSTVSKEWPKLLGNRMIIDEYGRIYRFPFIALNIFSKLIVRLLYLPNIFIFLYWKNGILLEYTTIELNVKTNQQEPCKQTAIIEYDFVEFQLSIRVRTPKQYHSIYRSVTLLQIIVDAIDTLLEEYSMRELTTRLIPCIHCINHENSIPGSTMNSTTSSVLSSSATTSSGTSSSSTAGNELNNVFLFTYTECVKAFVCDQEGFVFCNHIRSPSRMVSVSQLAPDIALIGIPLIDDKQLKICESIGKGGFGIVYRAELQPIQNSSTSSAASTPNPPAAGAPALPPGATALPKIDLSKINLKPTASPRSPTGKNNSPPVPPKVVSGSNPNATGGSVNLPTTIPTATPIGRGAGRGRGRARAMGHHNMVSPRNNMPPNPLIAQNQTTAIAANIIGQSQAASSEMKKKQVAVKELIWQDEHELAVMYSDFQQEVYMMNKTNKHPNIVRLYGVCIFPKPRLILELLTCGDLNSFLHPKDPNFPDQLQNFIEPKKFPWKLRLLIALDIAKGMAVLHNQFPPIIHRDLRSPNIFLHSLDPNSKLRAKVADFGLARTVAPNVGGALNTWQWLAPEVLGLLTDNNNKITYGCASDVYSFGVCCWEIATGGYPFDEFNDHPKYQGKSALIKEGITFAHLRPTLLPPAPDGDESKLIEGVNTPQLFIDLIQQCWQFDPTKRPTFNTIIYILSDLLSLDPNTQIPSPSLIQNNQNFDFSTLAEFNRASCRVSIDFVPLELQNLIKQKASSVVYHTEYIKQNTFVIPPPFKITSAYIYENSSELWIGDFTGSCFVLDLNTFSKVKQFSPHDQPIKSILSIGNLIYIFPLSGSISIWDPLNKNLVTEWNFRKNRIQCCQLVSPPNSPVQLWIGSANLVHIFSAERNLIQVLTVTKKLPVTSMVQHESLVWIGSTDQISIYDIETLNFNGCWDAHKGDILSMISVGNSVWTASSSGEISVWDVDDKDISCRKRMQVDGPVTHMFFSAIENRVWSCVGNIALVWDPKTLKPMQEITEIKGGIYVYKSMNLDSVYSVSKQGFVHSWEVAAGFKS